MRHESNTTKKRSKNRFSHAELYKIIEEDNFEYAFPNDIGSHIFLTLMVTNCSAELSFSHLKYIKTPTRTTMQQGRHAGCLSSTKYRSDVLREINFEDLINDFAIKKKVGGNFSNINSGSIQLIFFLMVYYCSYFELYIYGGWGTKIFEVLRASMGHNPVLLLVNCYHVQSGRS